MFSPTERAAFAKHGLFKRQNFLSPTKLAQARLVLEQHLANVGIWRDGKWFLGDCLVSTEPSAGLHLVKPLKRHEAFAALVAGEALAGASTLLDNQLVVPMDPYPQILFTLPNATNWTIPAKMWHLDLPRLPAAGPPGVQIFTFLESVKEGGGGTLAVTGSHQLLNEGIRIRSSDLRRRLKQEPYFAALMSVKTRERQCFLDKIGHVDGVELRVVEMVGEPGDVYFMDLRLLHTLAPNTLDIPRVMLTQRYLLEASAEAIS